VRRLRASRASIARMSGVTVAHVRVIGHFGAGIRT
jgi:hypothetical protein